MSKRGESTVIEATCSYCGGKVLLPDPLPNTQEQNIAFRKEWDALFEKGQMRLTKEYNE